VDTKYNDMKNIYKLIVFLLLSFFISCEETLDKNFSSLPVNNIAIDISQPAVDEIEQKEKEIFGSVSLNTLVKFQSTSEKGNKFLWDLSTFDGAGVAVDPESVTYEDGSDIVKSFTPLEEQLLVEGKELFLVFVEASGTGFVFKFNNEVQFEDGSVNNRVINIGVSEAVKPELFVNSDYLALEIKDDMGNVVKESMQNVLVGSGSSITVAVNETVKFTDATTTGIGEDENSNAKNNVAWIIDKELDSDGNSIEGTKDIEERDMLEDKTRSSREVIYTNAGTYDLEFFVTRRNPQALEATSGKIKINVIDPNATTASETIYNGNSITIVYPEELEPLTVDAVNDFIVTDLETNSEVTKESTTLSTDGKSVEIVLDDYYFDLSLEIKSGNIKSTSGSFTNKYTALVGAEDNIYSFGNFTGQTAQNSGGGTNWAGNGFKSIPQGNLSNWNPNVMVRVAGVGINDSEAIEFSFGPAASPDFFINNFSDGLATPDFKIPFMRVGAEPNDVGQRFIVTAQVKFTGKIPSKLTTFVVTKGGFPDSVLGDDTPGLFDLSNAIEGEFTTVSSIFTGSESILRAGSFNYVSLKVAAPENPTAGVTSTLVVDNIEIRRIK